jgi:hypothetical protein
MRKLRSLAMVLIIIACISAASTFASAAEITPQWDNVSTLTCILSISDTSASCVGKVTGMSGTSEINGTLVLYKKTGSSWAYVTSWSGSSATASLTIPGSVRVDRGHDYMAHLSVSVYRNGTWENAYKESSVVYCG